MQTCMGGNGLPVTLLCPQARNGRLIPINRQFGIHDRVHGELRWVPASRRHHVGALVRVHTLACHPSGCGRQRDGLGVWQYPTVLVPLSMSTQWHIMSRHMSATGTTSQQVPPYSNFVVTDVPLPTANWTEMAGMGVDVLQV